MKFPILLAAASLVSAAPAATEDITIEDLYIHKTIDADNKPAIDALSFRLSGRNATRLTCYADHPVFPDPTHATECGRHSRYYFQLVAGTDGAEYRINVLHDDDGLAFGYANVPSSCSSVGRGPKDIACVQTGPVSISIS